MKRIDSEKQFRLLGLIFLLSVVITACGQSIPDQGESIDSPSTPNRANKAVVAGGNRIVEEDLTGGVTWEQIMNQPKKNEQLSEPKQVSAARSDNDQDAAVHGSEPSNVSSGGSEAEELVVAGEETAASQVNTDEQSTTDERAAENDTGRATTGQNVVAETNVQLEEADPTPTAEQQVTAQQEETQPSPASSQDDKAQWDGDNTLTFSQLYASVGVRGIVLSDKVEALTGKEVEMSGFMAPPLTAGVRFFVLTKALMAVCPFCSTDADWPTDIVVVYLPDGEELKPTEHPVKVTGRLDTGSFRDEDTGFVSLVRIYADKVEVLK